MGRYMNKYNRIGEVTITEFSDVVDIDVPRMKKKRKICDTPNHNRIAGNSTSCCSSNSKSLDLDENGVEVTDNSSREKRSSSNEGEEESGELESKKMPPHDDEDPPPGKIPSRKEIEEFFTRCEKRMHKRFREKYNFDFEKEEPLEGRYKWVQT